jgi:predicted membrane protein
MPEPWTVAVLVFVVLNFFVSILSARQMVSRFTVLAVAMWSAAALVLSLVYILLGVGYAILLMLVVIALIITGIL